MAKDGRGWLSAIDLLPAECDDAIAWAGLELAKHERTQLEIYSDFKRLLQEAKLEHGIEFKIPSFSSFNRHVIKLAAATRRLEQAREVAQSVSGRLNAKSSDELTLFAGEQIKALITELLMARGEAGMSAKDVQALAQALKSVTGAQAVSATSKRKEADEEKASTQKMIDDVARETGLPADRIAQIRRDFLGVRQPPRSEKDGA